MRRQIQSEIIPETLSLLEYVSQSCSLAKKQPFRGKKILAVQHLLGSTIPFFAMLERGGVRPEDVFIVGKAYSSHPLVVKHLQKKGYRLIFEEVFDFIEDKPYDAILKEHIIDTTITLLEEIGENQQGLIIDDGGKAIELLHQNYKQKANQFVCIEQTSRGARTVSSIPKLMCPVINVARSDAKTLYESPSIAEAMVKEFIKSLRRWKKAKVFKTPTLKTLLLGYGFIGENVAKKLTAHGFDIVIYDSDKSRQKKARLNGLKTIEDLEKILKKVDIIIGCSGTQVIQHKKFQLLKPGALLVSMASTDMEFTAWNWRPKGKIVHQNILSSDLKYLKKYMPLSWRSLYKVFLFNKHFYLANGGFPIDFSGKINPVPLVDIQLTSALLLAGAIQAVNTLKPGLITLDSKRQNDIIKKYLKTKPS